MICLRGENSRQAEMMINRFCITAFPSKSKSLFFFFPAMQNFSSHLDCISIIWALDDADPVVLGVCIPWGVRASLPLHSAELFKWNFSVAYMTDKKMCYRSFKPEAVCYIIFRPNIDRKHKLFSIWLQKCAIDHSNQE